jgi:hypothetical protein
MRHRRRGENYCEPCRVEAAAYDRDRKTSQRRPRTNLAPCGTRAARRRHKDRNEPPCTTCQAATRPEPKLQPCGTVAADRRHRRNGEPVCDPCRKAATQERKKYMPEPTHPRNTLTTPEIIEEVRFLLNCGEGEHAILTALGYVGREKTLQCRLRKAGHQNLNVQLFGWELAA